MKLLRLKRSLQSLCLMFVPISALAQTLPHQAVSLQRYTVRQWQSQDGLPSSIVYAIAQTEDGYLWLGTADGLVRFDGIHFLQTPLSSDGKSSFGQVKALTVGEDGTLWIGTESGKFAALQGASFRFVTLPDSIESIHVGANSGVDVLTSNAVFRLSTTTMQILSTCQIAKRSHDPCIEPFVPSIPQATLASANLVPSQVQSVLRDTEQKIWIATKEHGVVRVEIRFSNNTPEIEHISKTNGLSNDAVLSLFQDREHNVWVGTQNGLNRLRYTKFSSITRDSGLPDEPINCIAAVATDLYIGSGTGLRILRVGSPLRSLLTEPVYALAAGHDKTLLAATSRGIVMTNGSESKLLPLGIQVHEIVSLALSTDGTIFFYDRLAGLYHWVPGGVAQRIVVPAMPHDSISVLRADDRGGLWVGFTKGPVAHLVGLKVRIFTKEDNLPGEMAHSISLDGPGAVWISSEAGLARISDDRVDRWYRTDGLPGNRVLWAVQGDDDRLWLGFNIGVAAGRLTGLTGASHRSSHFDLYDESDGLRGSPELKGNDSVAVTLDGRIWLMTATGLATIDPASIQKNEVPPLAKITDVTADDHSMKVKDLISLPRHTRRLEIEYTGLSFAEPRKVGFRYKLDNFDSDWHDVSTRRIATYTNLSPGTYQFHVMAVNEDGTWSVHPEAIVFMIPAAFYQTRWFIFLCLLVLMVLIVIAVRWRVRFATTQIRALFDERLKERTRLAQDLHDNLIQDVMGVSLQLEIADELTPSEAPGKPVLTRALTLASSALAEGRSALTALRETEANVDDVLKAISQVSHRFANPGRLSSELILVDSGFQLKAPVAEEIIMIGREAVGNALQHTAGTVRVSLSQSIDCLSLIVKDFGSGINGQVLQSGVPGHFGMTGMKERAASIQAELMIEADPTGTGTRILLKIPGRLAYREFDTMKLSWRHWRLRMLASCRNRSGTLDE